MKKLLLLTGILALSFLTTKNTFAQLDVAANGSPEDLVATLLGDGITVTSPPTLVCPDGASGTFDGQFTNLGLGEGIILTSGSVNNAVGPNNQGGAGTSNGTPGDPLLDAIELGGFGTNDGCLLEFSFIPFGDTLTFNYVFGSEEYEGFVCSSFNDVFGFFIEGGTQYPTPTNIALIPGTDLPVSINNVNIGVPDGGSEPCNLDNTEYYVDNGNGFTPNPNSTVQYDGFTVVLQAVAVVTPCEEYTITLGVADAGDTVLDSGVFIEAGSFSVNSVFVSATTTLTSIEGLDYTIEECVDGIITFSRNNVNESSLTIDFELGGTATNGVDYEFLENSITIGPNEESADLVIATLDDGVTEDPETITVTIINDLGCDTTLIQTVELELVDQTPMVVSEDVTISQGESVQLSVSGGGLNYFWNPPTYLDETNTDMPIATPDETTTYNVTSVIGACFYQEFVTVTVLECEQPDITLNVFDYCPSSIDFTFMAVPFGGTWEGPIEEVDGTYVPTATEPGVYEVSYTYTDEEDCTSTETATFTVVEDFNFVLDSAVCVDQNTYLAVFTITGGFGGDINYTVADIEGTTTSGSTVEVILPWDDSDDLIVFSEANDLGCNFTTTIAEPDCFYCDPLAGEINADDIFVCDGDFAFLDLADVIPNEESDPNDDNYIVHTANDGSIGEILLVITDEPVQFTLEDIAGAYNTPYYISRVVGFADDNGLVDPTDGCSDIAQGPSVVFLTPIEIESLFECFWETGIFEMTYSITGGLPAYDNSTSYFVLTAGNAELAFGETITLTYVDGDIATLDVVDDAACNGNYFEGPIACTKCYSTVGELNPDPINVCAGETITVMMNGQVINEADNVGIFYGLFESADLNPNEMITSNETGEFNVNDIDGAFPNQTYYIAGFITGLDDEGNPDLLSNCFQISESVTPVFFSQPTVQIDENCEDDIFKYITYIIQGGIPIDGNMYEVTYNGETQIIEGPFFYDTIDVTTITELPFILDLTVTDAIGCSISILQDETTICGGLSVELVRFDGETLENANRLFWTTASEVNTDYFIVERSYDGINFEALGVVNATGNSTTLTNYSYMDYEVKTGNVYYRLIEVENNGTQSNSGIVNLSRSETQNQISIFPNPTNGVVNVSLYATASDADYSVKLFDISGKLVFEEVIYRNDSQSTYQFDITSFASGVYFMEVSNGTVNDVTKIIKQ